MRLICLVRPEAMPGAEVLGHVLNKLDGVGYFGETAPLKGHQAGCIECASAATPESIKACPIYTDRLYSVLASAKTAAEWYGAFATAADVETVIASESDRRAYDLLGLEPGKDVNALVIYCNPLEWMVGAIRHHKLTYAVTPGDILELCGKWASFYSDHMRWLAVEEYPWASFDLYSFGRDPRLSLEKLCWYYQLKANDDAINWHSGEHHKAIGPWAVNGDPPPQDIVATSAYLSTFTPEAIKAVISDDMVQSNFRALQARKINRLT